MSEDSQNTERPGDEKASAEDAAQAKPGGGTAGGPDSVDRIRDILFGAQSRQFEQKLGFLEDLIGKEAARLREGTRQTAETLEGYTKREIEALLAQIRNERSERAESAGQLAASLDAAVKAIEKKMERSDESAQAGKRDLQEQIFQQSKALMDEIQRRHEDLLSALRRAEDELRKEKTDRIALGNLFTELGLRLKEEFKIPEGK